MNRLARLMKRAAVGLRAAAMRGPGLECPVCGGSFRRFLDDGTPRRTNARCPGCGSKERHRLLWLYLQRECGIERMTGRLLHIAPEAGIAARLKRFGGLRYVTADLHGRELDCRFDITKIPFADASFDLVVCSHVLEHIPDDVAAAAQIQRVLRDGGRALLMVPLDPSRRSTYEDRAIDTPALRLQHYGDSFHVRLYGADFRERLLRVFGCVEHVDYGGKLSRAEVERYGLWETEPLFLCRSTRPGAPSGSPPGSDLAHLLARQ